MNDSLATNAQEDEHGWLLLIHQIPPKPDYFRVKVRRRLQRMGAVALKNSVYVLPRRDDTREDFQWLLREVTADGGDAVLCEAAFVDGIADADLRALFRSERDAEYAEIEQLALMAGAEGRGAREQGRGAREHGGGGEELEGRRATGLEVGRLERRLSDAMRVDFFRAAGRAAAEHAVRMLAARTSTRPADEGGASAPRVRGRTWVTRAGVFIDRIASAWLIRRFLDPEATFKFVAAKGYRPEPGDLRFDMYQAEYTHEHERCTFETLLERFALDDSALRAIGEIVHDVDCKDDKFGRAEAAGIAAVVSGIALTTPQDAGRLERGRLVFDALYEQLTEKSK